MSLHPKTHHPSIKSVQKAAFLKIYPQSVNNRCSILNTFCFFIQLILWSILKASLSHFVLLHTMFPDCSTTHGCHTDKFYSSSKNQYRCYFAIPCVSAWKESHYATFILCSTVSCPSQDTGLTTFSFASDIWKLVNCAWQKSELLFVNILKIFIILLFILGEDCLKMCI